MRSSQEHGPELQSHWLELAGTLSTKPRHIITVCSYSFKIHNIGLILEINNSISPTSFAATSLSPCSTNTSSSSSSIVEHLCLATQTLSHWVLASYTATYSLSVVKLTLPGYSWSDIYNRKWICCKQKTILVECLFMGSFTRCGWGCFPQIVHFTISLT